MTYTVEQRITEGESSKTVRSAYLVTVYVDGSGNLTIIQNPTITSVPVKSGYTPKAVQLEKGSEKFVDFLRGDGIQ